MFVAADQKQYLNSNDKSAQIYATVFQSSTESMIDGQIDLNALTSFSKTSSTFALVASALVSIWMWIYIWSLKLKKMTNIMTLTSILLY